MSRTLIIILTLLFICITVGIVSADDVTVEIDLMPTLDTYVESAGGGAWYNDSVILNIRVDGAPAEQRIFLEYDISYLLTLDNLTINSVNFSYYPFAADCTADDYVWFRMMCIQPSNSSPSDLFNYANWGSEYLKHIYAWNISGSYYNFSSPAYFTDCPADIWSAVNNSTSWFAIGVHGFGGAAQFTLGVISNESAYDITPPFLTLNITYTPPPPEPSIDCDFTYTIDGDYNQTVHFYDNSTVNNTNITFWNWNFGDAWTSTCQNVTHNYTHYNAPTINLSNATACYGNFIVSLTVENETLGLICTVNKTITLTAPHYPVDYIDFSWINLLIPLIFIILAILILLVIIKYLGEII